MNVYARQSLRAANSASPGELTSRGYKAWQHPLLLLADSDGTHTVLCECQAGPTAICYAAPRADQGGIWLAGAPAGRR
jgi:hypothetical protein